MTDPSALISPSSPFGLISGSQIEVVGVEENAPDGFRVYIGHRMYGHYLLIEDETAQEAVRRAWANTTTRVLIPTPPPECVLTEGE